MADELEESGGEETPKHEESDLQVEVEAEPDKARPKLSDDEANKLTGDEPSEDEIGKYNREAQKRIKHLYMAGSEWRRRAAQSNRDLATATNLAEQLYRENQELRASTNRSEAALIEQAIQRADSQLAQARINAKLAHAANDPDAIVAANEEISRFVAEADRLRLLKPASGKEGKPAEDAAPAPPQQQPVPPSDRVQKWVQKNTWFNQPGNEEITGFTMGVHQSLERQGITEVSDPDRYFSTIDERLRKAFPDRFKEADAVTEEKNRRPVAVTGGQRTNGAAAATSRKVVLTESQVRIAKSLGITKEQYAAQLVKEQGERDRQKQGATIQ